jgi:hypothetical protein
MIDIEDPRAAGPLQRVGEERLAVVNRASREVVAVQVQQIERVVCEPLRLAASDGIVKAVEVGDAARVRAGYFAVEDDGSAEVREAGERG